MIPLTDIEWGRVRQVNGNQLYRKRPMFASWGHKFTLSCTTCIVPVVLPHPERVHEGELQLLVAPEIRVVEP